MADNIDNNELIEEEGSGFDYRKLWSIIVLNWYWLIFSALFFVAGAYIYLRYQSPVYTTAMKVLIKSSDQQSSSMKSSLGSLEGIVSNSNGFENEIEILGSASVATRTVKDLKLYVSYALEGRVTDSELYKNSPIIVDLEESRLDYLKFPVKIEMEQVGKKVEVQIILPSSNSKIEEVITRTISSFPAAINTRVGRIMFSKNPGYEMTERKLTATIYPPIMMGRAYAKSIAISPTSKLTTVAVLSMNDTHVERAMDYLQGLINSYNADANEDKNEVARKTEEFIKERIDIIRTELDETEGQLEGFKRSNELVNLPTDAGRAMSASSDYQQRQVEMQTQLTLISSLIEFCNNPDNCFEIIPANLGISDASVNNLMKSYNDNVLLRNRLIRSSSESSPRVLQLTDDVKSLWDAIGQQLRSIYSDTQVKKASVDQQYALFTGKVSNTPTQERVLNNIGRQQEIKAGLYLMLLQKREENFISLASTAAKARIIDEPQFGGKVSPRSNIIMAAALLLGIALPLVFFYLLEMLRFRIEGRQDIEKLTKLSVVADIPLASDLADGERAIVVKENSNNMMEEAFRSLRTNLRFIMSPTEKVLCCTSFVPGEGKTFIATNLAMSLALLGKHVLLVGLDVRKPRLVKLFGLPTSKKGLTSYLVGDHPDFNLLEDQITHGVFNDNLDVLPAGVIPPNPGELISRDLLDKAIDYLKTKYDLIILDTPPVGLVSDTYELSRLVDTTLFVVRSDFSVKSDFEMINRASSEKKLPNVNLVLNGVDLTKRKYGFYYGYGKYKQYSKYGTYYGRYGHYGTYGHYGDNSQHIEK